MEQIRVSIEGTAPLMMHADTFANPLHPATKLHKSLTSKRKKTDDDHLEIARSEFIAGAYWSKEDGFFIPGQNMDATLLAGAKLARLGTHWKRGGFVLENRIRIKHEGPNTPEELWEKPAFVDCRGVKVGQAKVMRYRPLFLSWSAEFTVVLNPDVLNLDEAKKAITDAGALIGTCEYRPRFGRFSVKFKE